MGCVDKLKSDLYTQTYTCDHILSDVDECLTDNGGCDSKRTCTNTPGGRTCGDCPSGWMDDGDTLCKGLCWLLDCSMSVRITVCNIGLVVKSK